MPCYKDYNYDQTKMLPIAFDRQILPGSVEYSLSCLIDTALDLSAFEQRYNNDENGRRANDPNLLLKIVILPTRRASPAASGIVKRQRILA